MKKINKSTLAIYAASVGIFSLIGYKYSDNLSTGKPFAVLFGIAAGACVGYLIDVEVKKSKDTTKSEESK